MPRRSLSLMLCLMLSVAPALAAAPLPPGRPAGLHRAQITETSGAIAIGALIVIAVAGYAISTPAYHVPGTATAAASTQP